MPQSTIPSTAKGKEFTLHSDRCCVRSTGRDLYNSFAHQRFDLAWGMHVCPIAVSQSTPTPKGKELALGGDHGRGHAVAKGKELAVGGDHCCVMTTAGHLLHSFADQSFDLARCVHVCQIVLPTHKEMVTTGGDL